MYSIARFCCFRLIYYSAGSSVISWYDFSLFRNILLLWKLKIHHQHDKSLPVELTFQFCLWPAYWRCTVISSHLRSCFQNDELSSVLLHEVQNNWLQFCFQSKWKFSTCCHCLYRHTVSAFKCHSSTVLAMCWGSLQASYMVPQLSCLVRALRQRNPSKQCSSRGASFVLLHNILQICVCCNPDC